MYYDGQMFPEEYRDGLFLAQWGTSDEVVQKFKELRGQTHAFLDEFGEEGLDRPTRCQPPGFSGFETAGRAIIIIAGHACGHLGGLTVVRAAAGKQRLFNPSEALRAF